ncbi:MAG TPA: DUF805 domain-containing protein [Caulobacteraceae bacterium]|nr:DUF805 domain-containing protein [Caulobacteraceae bacterium]
MRGSLDHPPIVVEGSRVRATLLAAGSLTFVLGGLYVVARSGGLAGFVPTLFFSLTGAVALWMVLQPPRLEVGPAGIAQRVLGRTHRLAWADIHDFRPASIGIGARAVGFDYLEERPKSGRLRRLSAAITGVEGMLQPGYELEPHRLADLLNHARERWIASEGAPAAVAVPAANPGFAGARMNRVVFWRCWGLVAALAAALWLAPGLGRSAPYVALVLAARLYAVRLQDIGRSGWWQLGLYSAQGATIALAAAAGWDLGTVGLGLALAAQAAFTLALGALPGEAGSNRFGPVPGQPTALGLAEAFR